MRILVPTALVAILAACQASPSPVSSKPLPPPELPPAETASRRESLAISVDDPARAASELESAAKAASGFVTARSETAQADDQPGSILLALTVDLRQAESLSRKARALGTVTGEESKVDDVAAEVVGVNAKLAGLRNVEARLRAWTEGPERDCAKLGDVEKDRAKVLDDIATLVARQKVQESRSQFATLTVRLVAPPPAAPDFVADVRKAVHRLVEDPAGAARLAAVQLVTWSPAVVLLGVILGWISRRRGRDHRRSGVPPAA